MLGRVPYPFARRAGHCVAAWRELALRLRLTCMRPCHRASVPCLNSVASGGLNGAQERGNNVTLKPITAQNSAASHPCWRWECLGLGRKECPHLGLISQSEVLKGWLVPPVPQITASYFSAPAIPFLLHQSLLLPQASPQASTSP
jgi:hypothetical protein